MQLTKVLLIGIILIFKFESVHGQDFLSIYEFPVTGLGKIRKTNGYILKYTAQNNDTSSWTLFARYITANAPNIDYPGINLYSERVNNAWADRLSFRDSFVLENSKVKELIKSSKYNYPGFTQNQLYRYVFKYDTANRLISYDLFISETINPTNYSIYSKTYITYDATNKRKKDSVVYSSSPSETTLIYYTYDNKDNLIFEASLTQGDTAYKSSYSYHNNQIKTVNRWQFNNTSDEWFLTSSDTFAYDANNRVSAYTRYGLYIANNQIGFTKFSTEYYGYNADNSLIETRAFNEFRGAFTDALKSVFYYSSGNKATLGYEYSGDSLGNWSPIASAKYSFDFLSSAPTLDYPISQRLLYPNPANTQLNLVEMNDATSAQLIDIYGKMIELPIQSNQIELQNIASGTYYVNILQQGAVLHRQKLVINHH